MLKIWSKDNIPQSEFQLAVKVTAIACSPQFRCLILGTAAGYIQVLDCNDQRKEAIPRLVHSFRLLGKAVTQIQFDPTASILLITGEDNPSTLMILSASSSRKWEVLGVVRCPDKIFGCRASKDAGGNIVVAVAISKNMGKTATDLVTFRLSPQLVAHPEKYFATPLHDFDEAMIGLTKLKLRVPLTAFDLERWDSMYLVTATKHLCHASSETGAKTPDLLQISDSLPFPVYRLQIFSGGKFFMTCNKQGAIQVGLGSYLKDA